MRVRINNLMLALESKLSWLLQHKHFDTITGSLFFMNPVALAPQLVTVIKANNVEGVSVSLWVIFATLQAAFTLVGIKAKNFGMFVSMALSAMISLSIVFITLSKT